MKKKQCPNCLCTVDLSAIACPFCKATLKLEKKEDLTTTLNGFKPPSVISGVPIKAPTIEKRVITPNIVPVVNKSTKELPKLESDINNEVYKLESEDLSIKNPFDSINTPISTLEISNSSSTNLSKNNNNNFNDSTITNEESFLEIDVINPFIDSKKQNEEVQNIKDIEKPKPPKPNVKKKTTRKLPKLEELEPEIIIPKKSKSNTSKLDEKKIKTNGTGKLNKTDNYLEELALEKEKSPLSFKEKLKMQAEAILKRSPKLEKLLKAQEKNNLHDTFDAHLDALGFSEKNMDLDDLKKLETESQHISAHELLENSIHGIKDILHFSNEKIHNQNILKQNKNNEIEEIKTNITEDIPVPKEIEKIKSTSVNSDKNKDKSNENEDKYYFAKKLYKRISKELNNTDPFIRDPFEIDNLEIAELHQNLPEEIENEFIKPEGFNVDPDELRELNELAMIISPEAQIDDSKNLKEESKILEQKEKDFSSREIIKVTSSDNKNKEEEKPFVKKSIKEAIDVLSEIEQENILNPFDNVDSLITNDDNADLNSNQNNLTGEASLEEEIEKVHFSELEENNTNKVLSNIDLAKENDTKNHNNIINKPLFSDEEIESFDSKKEESITPVLDSRLQKLIKKTEELNLKDPLKNTMVNPLEPLEVNNPFDSIEESNLDIFKEEEQETLLESTPQNLDVIEESITPVLDSRLQKLIKKTEELNLKDPLKNTMVNPLEPLEVNNPFDSIEESNLDIFKEEEQETLLESTPQNLDVIEESITPVLDSRLQKLIKKTEELNLKDPLKNTMVNPLEPLEVNNPFDSIEESNLDIFKEEEQETLLESTPQNLDVIEESNYLEQDNNYENDFDDKENSIEPLSNLNEDEEIDNIKQNPFELLDESSDEAFKLEPISSEALEASENDTSLIMIDDSFKHDETIEISKDGNLSLEVVSLDSIISSIDQEKESEQLLLNSKNSLEFMEQLEEDNNEYFEEDISLKSKDEVSNKKTDKINLRSNKNNILKEENTKLSKDTNITSKKTFNSKVYEDEENSIEYKKGSFEVIHKGAVKEVTLDDIIKSGPRGSLNENAIQHFLIAKDLCVKGNYKVALLELEEAVKIDPAYEEAHILLSRTYLKLKSMNLVWIKN